MKKPFGFIVLIDNTITQYIPPCLARFPYNPIDLLCIHLLFKESKSQNNTKPLGFFIFFPGGTGESGR